MSFSFRLLFCLLLACTPQLSTSEAPCPCAAGFICCTAKNVCVIEEALPGCEAMTRPPSCTNGVEDDNETDVDCGGGTCGRCVFTRQCANGDDCQSGVCAQGTCARPTASLVIATLQNTPSEATAATVTTIEPLLSYVFSVQSTPAHGVVDVANNLFVYTPATQFFGTDSFAFRATANDNSFIDGTASVTVTHVNQPPVISGSPSTSWKAGSLFVFSPEASDPDPDDTLTFSAVNLPGWASLDAMTGVFSGTPSAADIGTSSGIVIRVTDGGGLSASLNAFSIDVATNVPPGPVLGLTATTGNQKVELCWANPGDSSFTGVTIRSAAGACPSGPSAGSGVYEGTGTCTVVTGLPNGTNFCFSAFSHDAFDNYAAAATVTSTPLAPWSSGATIPVATTSSSAVVANGKIYLFGGAFAEGWVQEYDPAIDSWTNCGDPAPGNACAPLPTPRQSHAAVTGPSGTIFIIGGMSASGPISLPGGPYGAVEEYDPTTNTWVNCNAFSFTGCANVSTAPHSETLALLGGANGDLIYVVGDGSSVPTASAVQAYQTSTNTWVNCGSPDPGNACTSLPVSPYGTGVSFAANQHGLHVLGGWQYSGTGIVPDTIYTYNFFSGDLGSAWESKASLPLGRAFAASATLQNEVIYLLGGLSCYSATDTSCQGFDVPWVDSYDPQRGTPWQSHTPMPAALKHMTAVAWQGKIYTFGGSNLGTYASNAVYIYDPSLEW